MARRYVWAAVAGLALGAACADDVSSPTARPALPAATPQAQVADWEPDDNVGTMGYLEEIKPQGQGLVVRQTGFDFTPSSHVKVGKIDQRFAVGNRHNKLEVAIDRDAKIYVNGEEKTVDDLTVGALLMLSGRRHGASMRAYVVTDLAAYGPPPEDASLRMGPPRTPAPQGAGAFTAEPTVTATSLCMGQDLAYGPDVSEFQGCWGGPSAADDINIPDIPIGCPLIGCFVMDRFSYTVALGGWGFAFPFQFSATSPGLVYHIPGDVSLGLAPLPATTGSFSFWGGIGIDVGINIDFCSFWGCSDVYTLHLSEFSMIHQATGAAPLSGRLDIAEVACPGIGIIPIDLPVDPIAIALCEDLGLEGDALWTHVDVPGSAPPVSHWQDFTGPVEPITVRPDALSVTVRYDEFQWVPDLTVGLSFKVEVFTIDVWTSPTIPLTSGPFAAITTPFPLAGSPFTLATDPLSPVGDLRYLYHPTLASVQLEVAPAPTTLAIRSGPFVVEGDPVVAQLQEEYDGSPIANQAVAFQFAGLGGSETVTRVGVTDATGTARVVPPNGEYALTASFAGIDVYLPSSATQDPVYVYRPTSFVVWGGNPEGVVAGGTYQFWGSQWWRQVRAGEYHGNASFLGFADPLGPTAWISPPASAAHGPDALPDIISVIITTRVDGRGSRSLGNIASHVVVRVVDPAGYAPNGGHEAWGVMRAPLPSD